MSEPRLKTTDSKAETSSNNIDHDNCVDIFSIPLSASTLNYPCKKLSPFLNCEINQDDTSGSSSFCSSHTAKTINQYTNCDKLKDSHRKWYQFLGLLYRFYLLHKRNSVGTLSDVLLPVGIILMMCWMRSLVKPIVVDEAHYINPRYLRCLFGLYGPLLKVDLRSLDIRTDTINYIESKFGSAERAFCQDYSVLETHHELDEDFPVATLSAERIRTLGKSIELFPLLPKRMYHGFNLLSLPGRMNGKPLYLQNTKLGDCSNLAKTFRSIIKGILGDSRIDPYCSCKDQESNYCCEQEFNLTYPKVVVIDDPKHEVLKTQSNIPVFAVIVCHLTDYKKLNFHFDIRMSRADEMIGSTFGSPIQFDHRVYPHDPIEPIHYVAGIIKPPKQKYSGGFLDIQSIIHYHILNSHQIKTFTNRHVDDDGDRFLNIMTPAERSLIFNNESKIDLIPWSWPPIQYSKEGFNYGTWQLLKLLNKVCSICNIYQQHFKTRKDGDWCKRISNYIYHSSIFEDNQKKTIMIPMLLLLTMTPTSNRTLCLEWKIKTIIDLIPLDQSQQTLLAGIIVTALMDWLRDTTTVLDQFVPVKFIESGMPDQSGIYDVFNVLTLPISGLLWMGVFIAPIWKLCKLLNKDKKNRIEEYFRIMGVPDYVIWSSWFVFFGFYHMIISLIVAAVSIQLFADTSIVILFTLFYLTYLCSLAYCILLTRSVSSGNLAGGLGITCFLLSYFLFLAFEASGILFSPIVKHIAMLFYPAALSWGVTVAMAFTLSAQSGARRGLNLTHMTDTYYGISISSVFMMLSIDVVIYFIMGYYIGQVAPGEYGVPKAWNFIFSPSFWCPQRNPLHEYRKYMWFQRNEFQHNDKGKKRGKKSHCETGFYKETRSVFQDQYISADIMNILPESSDVSDGSIDSENHCSQGYSSSQRSSLMPSRSAIVEVNRLSKEFNVDSCDWLKRVCGRRKKGRVQKKTKISAVNEVSFRVYENELVALVGNNGAGKTTLINMLAGMLFPTSGEAKIDGYDIEKEYRTRNRIGYCLQQDILFNNLTVEEHLIIYGLLKGMKGNFLKQNIEQILKELGLTEKRSSIVCSLSGGQKRRLSISIGILGNSRVLFLDEPASGLDSLARRDLWDILKSVKIGRCIVMITHEMNEIDRIVNRTIIMHNGSIVAIGTPYYLKSELKLGYTLVITTEGSQLEEEDFQICTERERKKQEQPTQNSDAEDYYSYSLGIYKNINNLVLSHVPTAHSVGQSGREYKFSIPVQEIRGLSRLLSRIELEQEQCKKQKRKFDSSEHLNHRYQFCGYNFDLPPPLPKSLSNEVSKLNIIQYSLSLPTLEDVFLQLNERYSKGRIRSNPKLTTKFIVSNCQEPTTTSAKEFLSTSNLSIGSLNNSQIESHLTELQHEIEESYQLNRPKFFSVLSILLVKKLNLVLSDTLGLACQVFLPTSIILAVAVMSYVITRISNPPILLHVDALRSFPYRYLTPQYIPVGGRETDNNEFDYCAPNWSVRNIDVHSVTEMDDWLFHHPSSSYSALYRLQNDSVADYVLFYNSSFSHAIPTTVNMIMECQLRKHIREANIMIRNYPLPRSMYYVEYAIQVSIGIWVAIGISLIPAMWRVPTTHEMKHIQLLYGITITEYWTSTYIWDLIMFFSPTLIILALLLFFHLGIVGPKRLLPFCLSTLIFGLAINPFAYLLTILFRSNAAARLSVIVSAFALPVLISAARIIPEASKDWNQWLKYLVMWIPTTSLTQIYLELVLTPLTKSVWKRISVPLIYMSFSAPLYFLLCLLIDSLISRTITNKWNRIMKLDACCCFQKPRSEQPSNEDPDVVHERQSIQRYLLERPLKPDTRHRQESNGYPYVGGETDTGFAIPLEENPTGRGEYIAQHLKSPRNDNLSISSESSSNSNSHLNENMVDNEVKDPTVLVVDLYKRYLKRCKIKNPYEIALNHVWFSVPNAKCLGLLGENGSGKSTMIKILSGLIPATSGIADICGINVSKNPSEVWPLISLCPQTDYLYDRLTVSQHISFFSRLRGLNGERIKWCIKTLIDLFDFEEYAEQRVMNLSGGNKRKLAVALSILKSSPILLLDEPTCGIDPVSRRRLWSILFSLCISHRPSYSKRAIILTSHSMAECEALCNKATVLAHGNIIAVGSIPNLKSKYSDLYELHVEVKDPSRFTADLRILFSDIRLISQFGSYMTLSIQSTDRSLAQLMHLMLSIKDRYQIKSFAVSHVGLESVLTHLLDQQSTLLETSP